MFANEPLDHFVGADLRLEKYSQGIEMAETEGFEPSIRLYKRITV